MGGGDNLRQSSDGFLGPDNVAVSGGSTRIKEGLLTNLVNGKEVVPKISKLEDENFYIDSTSWTEIAIRDGLKVLQNPQGDVWEILEGDFKGEQYFTGPLYDQETGELLEEGSAIRETRKAGKRLPGSGIVIKDILQTKKKYGGYARNYPKFLKSLNIKFCGWYNSKNGKFNNTNELFYLWCKDGSIFCGDYEIRANDKPNSDELVHNKHRHKDGCSVRCVSDYVG